MRGIHLDRPHHSISSRSEKCVGNASPCITININITGDVLSKFHQASLAFLWISLHFLLGCTRFHRFSFWVTVRYTVLHLIYMGYNGLHQFIPGQNGLYQAILGYTGLYQVILGFTRLYWVLLGYTRLYWVLLGFTGFYCVLLGYTGLC